MNFAAPDWFKADPEKAIYIFAGLILLSLAVGLWLWLGRGPRWRRAYRRAQRFVDLQAFDQAFAALDFLKKMGRLPSSWESRFRLLQGRCHALAGEAGLKELHYEDSLEHLLAAAKLLEQDPKAARDLVLADMLKELRRQFATRNDSQEANRLIERILSLEPACAEALFWRGMCKVRDKQIDAALATWQQACPYTGGKNLDLPLYMGALLLREGRPQEALKHLAEAYQLEQDCPLVTWQLGMAIVAGVQASYGGEGLAVRALQRALQGLPRWRKEPRKLWQEGLPERSFVRRLALEHPFVCPVMGADVGVMIRQGQVALAQAHYRLGHFSEAAELFESILADSPPSVPVLRGLGLALARLGRFDQAFKHLRAAHEQEEPKLPLTAGYLALCGAKGKPLIPEDKARNIAWAIRLLGQYFHPVGPNNQHTAEEKEWAEIHNAIHAEARAAGLTVAAEDQVRLCEALARVEATDADAGVAYAYLMATHPRAVRPEYAWLFARSAEQHNISCEGELALLAVAFRDQPAARDYFAQRQWNFRDIEFHFLARHADQNPGAFPEIFGDDYPRHGEQLLLNRSREEEERGRLEASLRTAEVLLKLAPRSTQAHDRLASLHYQRRDLDRCAELLDDWRHLEPANPWPPLRLAIVQHQRGLPAECFEAIHQALALTQGRRRAAVALLAAKLALKVSPTSKNPELSTQNLMQALDFITDSLEHDPAQPDALWCAAAVRVRLEDWDGLALQASAMHLPGVADARFHYMAGVCHLAAKNYAEVIAAGHWAAEDPALAAECSYLMGLAHLEMNDISPAVVNFQAVVAEKGTGPSADLARALLGQISFARGAYDGALKWWTVLDSQKRKIWGLEAILGMIHFLAGLANLDLGQFEHAAKRFREAGVLGYNDRRLVPLRILALVEASKRLLTFETKDRNGKLGKESPASPKLASLSAAVALPQEAIDAGCRDVPVFYLLAQGHKRQGNWAKAREILSAVVPADAQVHSQLGILALNENRLADAEQEFAQAAQLDPHNYPHLHNRLLTLLSLGRLEDAGALAVKVVEVAPNQEEKRRFALVHHLVRTRDTADREKASAAIGRRDEDLVIHLAKSLGHLDAAAALLKTLVVLRPDSDAAQQASLAATLVQAKKLLERCDWVEAEVLLAPWVRQEKIARPTKVGLFNLLGCCACLGQNAEGGMQFFRAAIQVAGEDARLYQNLALSCEWQGHLDQAEPHWNRFLELLDERWPGPNQHPDLDGLRYETLDRLSGRFSEKENWSKAQRYLQRAQGYRPQDIDTLERLFHLCQQVPQTQDAARALKKLRQLRPQEPVYELYGLELVEVRTLEDADQVVTDLDKILKSHVQDPKLEERAGSLLGQMILVMRRLVRQQEEQLDKAAARLRRYQTDLKNWPEMQDYLGDLRKRLNQAKRVTAKYLLLAATDAQRKLIRNLREEIEEALARCQRWLDN